MASLWVDGKEITCKGYRCAGSGEIEGELYYLANRDAYFMKQCKDKIVMIDGRPDHRLYQDIFANEAKGFITYDGHVNYTDCDIDQRELRAHVSNENKIPGVNIHVKDAVKMIKNDAKTAKIILKQDEGRGNSHNVIVDQPGTVDEWIIFTAHYDSAPLSTGTYDNMSGCIALLGILEHFIDKPHRYGLRFLWCGSEERGLLGSMAYCAQHEEELHKIVLNTNLDMIGSVMGRFVACSTAEDKLAHYIEYFANELGFGMDSSTGVYPSDSTPMADKGIPAVTFAWSAPDNTATVHNRYDTIEVVKAGQLKKILTF